MNIKEKIEFFLKQMHTMTKQDSDFIQQVINWDEEKKSAFIFAKRIFEEDIEKHEDSTS